MKAKEILEKVQAIHENREKTRNYTSDLLYDLERLQTAEEIGQFVEDNGISGRARRVLRRFIRRIRP